MTYHNVPREIAIISGELIPHVQTHQKIMLCVYIYIYMCIYICI